MALFLILTGMIQCKTFGLLLPLFYCAVSAHSVIGNIMVLVEVTYKRRETVQSVRRLGKDRLYKYTSFNDRVNYLFMAGCILKQI